MLALAISALFTASGIIAVWVIADALLTARAAYDRLMREGAVMRAGFALQSAALEMQLRPAFVRPGPVRPAPARLAIPRSVTARQRPARLQLLSLQAGAAA